MNEILSDLPVQRHVMLPTPEVLLPLETDLYPRHEVGARPAERHQLAVSVIVAVSSIKPSLQLPASLLVTLHPGPHSLFLLWFGFVMH